MKRSVFVVLGLLALLVLAVTPTFGQGGIVYNSSFMIQNLSPDAAANVVIDYYGQDGSTFQESKTIPAGGSYTSPYPLTILPDNWTGSAVISSDQPVAAISNLGGNNLAFGAAYTGFNAGAPKVYLPLLMCNNYGFNTWLNVQNAGPSDATVTITYYPGVAGKSGLSDTATIKPGASRTFNQAEGSTGAKTCADLKDGSGKFIGSAVVESNQPVVAAVNQVGPTTLLTYNGFLDTAGSSNAALPFINTNNYGYVTGVTVQNLGSLATDVTMTLLPGAGSPALPPATKTIQPGQSVQFDDKLYGAGQTQTFVGSALLSSTGNQPIVAIVNQLNTGAKKGSSYNGVAVSTASNKISMPVIMDRNYGYFTGFNVQNVGTGTCSVAVTYSNTSKTDSFTLAAGAVINKNQINQIADKYVGAAKLVASETDCKMVAAVNELNTTSAGDSFFTYNAFNY